MTCGAGDALRELPILLKPSRFCIYFNVGQAYFVFMKSRISAAVVLAFVALIPALAQSIQTSLIRDGQAYPIEIDDRLLRNTPSWDPETQEIPLSMPAAIRIARENLKRLAPKANKDWLLVKADLQRIGQRRNKWIYEIEFYCYLSDSLCDGVDDLVTIWVKLDGKILEPTIYPEDLDLMHRRNVPPPKPTKPIVKNL